MKELALLISRAKPIDPTLDLGDRLDVLVQDSKAQAFGIEAAVPVGDVQPA